MELFLIYFCVIFLMFLWFETDAVPYYLKLFKIKHSKYQEFFKEKESSPIQINYPRFLLLQNKDSFLFNLLECEQCIAVWLVGIFQFIFSVNILWIGFLSILVWIGFPLVKYIIKKFNEY